MSTLSVFLRDGRLGPLAAGMTENEVRERLGEPDDVSVSSRPRILKYGPLEISFAKQQPDERLTLTSIHTYFGDRGDLSQALGVEGWWPEPGMTAQALVDRLRGEGLTLWEWGSIKTPGPPVRNYRVVEGPGARIVFNEERLHSLHWAVPPVKTRQFMMSFPVDTHYAIQRRASRSKLSVSDLCKRWILERLASVEAGSG